MKYTRVYADAEGESHFEDIEVTTEDTIFAPPAPPLRLSEFIATSRFSFLSAAPGLGPKRWNRKAGGVAPLALLWSKIMLSMMSVNILKI